MLLVFVLIERRSRYVTVTLVAKFLDDNKPKIHQLNNRKRFPCLHSLIETRGGWENSRELCKPKTKSRVCITVENSPNACQKLAKFSWLNPKGSYLSLKKWKTKIFELVHRLLEAGA